MASQIDYDQHFDEYIRRIKVLNERIWENRVNQNVIDRWLENFTGAIEPVHVERLYALHLLSNFMYFGSREMRELLKSLYRDHISYPMLRSIRLANGGTTDLSILEPELLTRLRCTRFLGMRNPSESGTHLLYSFRQENGLSKTLFINTHEIFSYDPGGTVALANANIEHYVFLDDLAGSGTQARQYSTGVVALLKL